MPKNLLHCLFQFKSFDTIFAVSHEGRIIVKRRDGFLQGAVYDVDKDSWDTDWRIPVNSVPWFAAKPPCVHKELVVPWENYLTECHTYVAPERGKRRVVISDPPRPAISWSKHFGDNIINSAHATRWSAGVNNNLDALIRIWWFRGTTATLVWHLSEENGESSSVNDIAIKTFLP